MGVVHHTDAVREWTYDASRPFSVSKQRGDQMIGTPQMRTLAGAMAMAALLTPTALAAQSLSDEWQFRATIYGWLPDIDGTTAFPTGTGSSINVDARQIIDTLKFTFMGTFEAYKGRWGVLTDLVYLDVGGSKSENRDLSIDHVTLPSGISANTTLDIKALVWTVAGSYRIATDPGATFDVVAGARLLDLKQTLGWQFSADIGGVSPPPRSGSHEIKAKVWDGIVGVKGRLAFGGDREWFVPYYADVGTGDSELTWQGVAGLGYAFRWGELFAAWRYLDYKFKSGSPIEDVNLNGPALGVAFRW